LSREVGRGRRGAPHTPPPRRVPLPLPQEPPTTEDEEPIPKPIPLQLKYWKWGFGSTRKYFTGTRLLVTQFSSIHGPFRAGVLSLPPLLAAPAEESSLPCQQVPPSPLRRRHGENPLVVTGGLGSSEILRRTGLGEDASLSPGRIQSFSVYEVHPPERANGTTPSPPLPPIPSGSYFQYPRPDDLDVKLPTTATISSFTSNQDPFNYASTSVSTTSTAIYKPKSQFILPLSDEKSEGSSVSVVSVGDKFQATTPYLSYGDFALINVSPRRVLPRGSRISKETSFRRGNGFRSQFVGRRDRRRVKYRFGEEWAFGDPRLQAALRRVGIDERSVLRRDRRVRITCCREDARFIYLVYSIITLLSEFEEVPCLQLFLISFITVHTVVSEVAGLRVLLLFSFLIIQIIMLFSRSCRVNWRVMQILWQHWVVPPVRRLREWIARRMLKHLYAA